MYRRSPISSVTVTRYPYPSLFGSVLLVVPLGVLGLVLFTMMRGLAADVYFNVGLITIIGLAAKNAILIVEFAIELEAEGKSPTEATLEAVKRSEERRVGKECVSTCRSRWSPYH